MAGWRLDLETGPVEAQRQKPCKGKRLGGPQHQAKPAAS